MRILHLLSQTQLTGAEVYAAELIAQQKLSGHDVFQISNDFFYETTALQIKLNVETKTFFEFLNSILKLRQFLIKNNIQIIHAHSRAASKLAYYARIRLHIGFISTIHGRQHISVSKKTTNIYGDFLVPVCENIASQLKNEFKYNPQRIKTIENGLNLSKFYFQSHFESHCQSARVMSIAVIGRDSGPKKNRTEFFIDGFSKILDAQKINYKFFIIGGAQKNFNIQTQNIEFYTEPVVLNSDFYHKFDLICGSGRVCIESLLCGVPVIAYGEFKYCGLVTEKNYAEFKKSNFGDIGENFNLPLFNEAQAKLDLQNYQSLKSDDEIINSKVEFKTDLKIHLQINLKNLSALASSDYNLKNICKKIERIYESSYFLRHYSKWIPILMYHKIPDQKLNSPHKIFVTKNNFEKHLQIFKFLGFTTLTFSDLSDYRKGLRSFCEFPKKPLILTFDDGYQDNILNADPLLKKYNFKAQVFLLAQSDLKSNVWDQTTPLDQGVEPSLTQKDFLVSGTDRQQWATTHFEIGSHGLKHEEMPPMSVDEKMFELSESKLKLELEFKKPMTTFAFTYGLTNSDCAMACEKAGYDYGLNTDQGGFLIEENPYSIFRVNIFPDESFLSLWKKTSTWYRKYYYFKRKV